MYSSDTALSVTVMAIRLDRGFSHCGAVHTPYFVLLYVRRFRMPPCVRPPNLVVQTLWLSKQVVTLITSTNRFVRLQALQ